jgi:hypothetical protein
MKHPMSQTWHPIKDTIDYMVKVEQSQIASLPYLCLCKDETIGHCCCLYDAFMVCACHYMGAAK